MNTPAPVKIIDPVILIRINKTYRNDMSAHALYEATRGVWVVGPRRENAKLALAVFNGMVREVYEIREWQPAGTTAYTTRNRETLPLDPDFRFGCGTFTHPISRHALISAGSARRTPPK